jgi:hypothetical protein
VYLRFRGSPIDVRFTRREVIPGHSGIADGRSSRLAGRGN